MVDYLSKFRMYGYGYTSPDHRYPVATHRELNHEVAPRIFSRRPVAHDCREELMKANTDRGDWETWLLAQGLRETYQSVDELHRKEVEERPSSSKKKPDKLLFNVGLRGTGDGDFRYPRGITNNMDGDIIVADCLNHRVQILSSFAFYKSKFGSKGTGDGQFDEPTGVTELPNGDLAVADKNNKRIQVFTPTGEYKFQFTTVHRPYSVSSDSDFNIVVSTTHRTIEIYRRAGKLVNRFNIGGKQQSACALQICTNDKDEVIVCDPSDSHVKFFSYEGRLLYKFEPVSNGDGLAMLPVAICRTPLDQIIVGDTLNHTVNLYTERGMLLQQLLCPTDDVGTVQTCVVSPEGHLVVTEFSISGNHCVKVFRHRECACHANRPGSSKRRTPTTPN